MADLTAYDYDIFLSHNHADQEWTAKLAERLEQEDYLGRKIKVFFSPWDIRPGQSIPKEIERALPKSRKVGLIMSPDAITSAWVELERLVTTYIAVTARDERLIPLHRRDCEIPALLQPILSIDFRDDDSFEENYQALLHAIKDEPVPRRSRSSANSSTQLSPLIPRPPVVGFVARRDDEGRDIIEQLKEELAPHRNQLVALSGTGGVGKTTLAAEAARALSESFGQRVVWSSALGRDDYSFATLLDDIVTQLGQPDLRALPPDKKAKQVQTLLASAPALIIVDNFETIKPEEETRCVEFLSSQVNCPALIAGREKIDKASRITIPVMSPDEANEFLDLLIKQTGEVALFAQVDRDRIMTESERTPLVMEWIIGQIDLAQDPDSVLDEFAHGMGDAAQRVFDRSFGLVQLGDDGRATLLALSLFAPDASRDALAEVASFGADTKRLNEAVKGLARLHLVKSAAGARLTVAGLTRELAKARLSKDQRADEFRKRFVAYFLDYLEAHMQPTAADYDALEAEKDNLLRAMSVAFDLGDFRSVQTIARIIFAPVAGVLVIRGYWDEAIRCGEQALEAAVKTNDEWAIAEFGGNSAAWRYQRGEYDEARHGYQQALAAFRKLESDENIAVALHQLAILAQAQGDVDEARRLYQQSLEIERKLGNQSGIAITLHELGRLAQAQGDVDEARRLYQQSLEISQKLGNQSGIAMTLHELGRLAQAQGNMDEARRLYQQSLEISRKLGNQSGIAMTLHQLAMLAQAQGDADEARRLYQQSLVISQKLGNQSGIAGTLHQLGRLTQAQGDVDEARRLYQQSLEIERKLGNQSGIAITLHQLGRLAQDQGDVDEARRLYRQSLEIKRKLGSQSGIAITLNNLGRLAEDAGSTNEAAKLFREALMIFEKLGSPDADMARQSLERVEGKSS